ncbi:hypothetical protein ACLI08_06240 [Flavobacterium sp. RNTU_13]|uniref:hypothetical protein n=1 Tax=Flavobacterium sp. RNTU_13 TaxID=3375145 RepID=UPI0039865D3F
MDIFFLQIIIFVIIIIAALYIRHTINEKRTAAVVLAINGKIVVKIKNIKAEVFSNGAQDWKFNFRKCDVYVLSDAIFLATYKTVIKGVPVFLTYNKELYNAVIPQYALVNLKKINPDSYGKSVYLEYQHQEGNSHKFNVDMHLYGLTEAQREYFRF